MSAAQEGALLPRGKGKHASADAPAPKRQRTSAVEPPLFTTRKQPKHKAALQKKPDARPAAPGTTTAADVRSLLTFARISVGQKFLALVKSTNQHFVVLSLPDNLSAVLNWADVSDEHHAAVEAGSALEGHLPVHSFVRCIVVAKTDDAGSKALRVSCRASLLNKGVTLAAGDVVFGSVKSVEDHGLLCNLGLGRVTGFIKDSTSLALQVGQPFEAAVTRVHNNVAHLDVSPDVVTAAVLADRKGLNLATLQPGPLVQVEPDRELADGGLVVRFLGMLQGTIDVFHRGLGGGIARVLWVDPATKTVGLSALPHVLARNGAYAAERKAALGAELVEDATVSKVHKHVGLSLSLGGAGALGFAHASRLVDDAKADRPELRFASEQKTRARVVGESAMDGALLVSLQPSVLDAAVLTYAELAPGAVVKGEVIKLSEQGVVLKLGLAVRGLVPAMHLADAKVVDVERRFKLGDVVKARVLHCDAAAEKCQLTLKKSLVASALPVLAAYEASALGQVTVGVVSKAAEFGVIVHFYAGVHGLLPAHTLGAAAGDPAQYYTPGQALKVRVVQVDVGRQRMLLSLDTTGPLPSAADGAAPGPDAAHAPGSVVAPGVAVVQAVDATGVLLDLGGGGGGARAFVPVAHLSDHAELCAALLKTYAKGHKLKQPVLVLAAKSARPGARLATLKPELVRVARAGELALVFEQLQPEHVLSGYVAQSTSAGVFVRFGSALTVLAPKDNDDGGAAAWELGQTVRASISSVDPEKKRAVASLKLGVVGSRGSAAWLASKLADLARIRGGGAAAAAADKRVPRPGQAVFATAQARMDGSGAEAAEALPVVLDGGLPGLCHGGGDAVAVGTRLECRMLHWNGELAHVSVGLQGARWRSSGAAAEDGVEARVEMLLFAEGLAVVSMQPGPVLSLLAVRSFNGPLLRSAAQCAVGTELRVRFGEGDEVAELEAERGARGRTRARSGSLSEWMGPKASVVEGATVTCRVNGIHGSWMIVDVRGDKRKGRVHSCDVIDSPAKRQRLRQPGIAGAFAAHSVGDFVNAKVVAVKHGTVFLTLRPSEFAGARVGRLSWASPELVVGAELDGWVDELLPDGVAVGLSREVRGIVFCTDVCDDEAELDALFNRGEAAAVLPVGRPVRVVVTALDRQREKCTLAMRWQ